MQPKHEVPNEDHDERSEHHQHDVEQLRLHVPLLLHAGVYVRLGVSVWRQLRVHQL
jgi:hypothetical protein